MYPASGSFEQDTHRVSAEVSVVDGQFATEPMTVVKQAEQQVSEEDLHYFFEQAISVRFNRVSESLSGAGIMCSSLQSKNIWRALQTIEKAVDHVLVNVFPNAHEQDVSRLHTYIWLSRRVFFKPL